MVRITIDRRSNNVLRLLPLLRELRTEAMNQAGYISGETLVNADDRSNIVVISNWVNLKDWRAWQKKKRRIEIELRIEPLLVEAPKVTTWRHLSYRKNIGEE